MKLFNDDREFWEAVFYGAATALVAGVAIASVIFVLGVVLDMQ